MRLAILIGLLATAIHSAPAGAVDAAALAAEKPPALLSDYGFFEGPRISAPAEGVREFDLVTPLFSDRAMKTRHVHVPAGEKAKYVESEAFEFPVGTALIKTFAYPADFRQPDRDVRLVETRLLIRQDDGWKAFAYVWNDAQTDAELKPAGKRLPISFIDEAGETVSFSYAVPNRNQCKGCHAIHGEVVPLGPKARNLNKASPDGDVATGTAINQLEAWAQAGILDGLPPLETVEKAAAAFDMEKPLDLRARTWLDVNCAHCHRREGPASNSGLFLTFGEKDSVALGIGKRPVAAGRGAGDNEYDIVAGEPDKSILIGRVESVEPGIMMPELGRNLADPQAAALLREWVASLD
jgi:uncharacterized repeat protein (TIGR03806 family)